MLITVGPDGSVQAMYSEQIDLGELGPTTIQRASEIEPDHKGQWWATIYHDSPLRTRLGPFAKRSEAIAAEIAWIEENRL